MADKQLELTYEKLGDELAAIETRNFERTGLPFRIGRQTKTAGMERYPNKHRDYEFLQILSGKGNVTVDLDGITVNEGDLVAVNSNKIHSIATDGEVSFICLIVDYDYMVSLNDGNEPNFSERVNDPDVFRELRALLLEISCNLRCKKRALLARLDVALITLIRNHTEERPTAGESKTLVKIKKAIEYMKENTGSDFSLERVAEHCGMSKYYFCREFGRITGQSPAVYMNSLRCEKARVLLSAGHHSVSEVSDMCGFSSPSYFALVFKGIYGMSPKDFRKGK